MRADLDLLCISVYCTADDLLPARPGEWSSEAERRGDRHLVRSAGADGYPVGRRFLRAAKRQLGHLFPWLPSQDALHKRRQRLGDTIEWLSSVVATQCPGADDDLVLLDSTPVECGRSVETTRRSELADVCGTATARVTPAGFGACGCTCSAPPTVPRVLPPSSPLTVPNATLRCRCSHGRSRAARPIVCDKGYAGREFEQAVRELGGLIVRPPARRTRQKRSPRTDPTADRPSS